MRNASPDKTEPHQSLSLDNSEVFPKDVDCLGEEEWKETCQ